MKKLVLVLLIAFVFLASSLCALTSKINAQNFTSQDERKTQDVSFTAAKAYEDYKYQESHYLESFADYEDAKTFYKKNPTLQLREEARLKTLALLISRDQLMVVYLTALRQYTVESTGFTTDEKAVIFDKIDPEVAWYQSHVASYSDGDELNTLFTKSDESKTRFTALTKAIIYNSLLDISLSQEIGLRVDHQAIYTDLKSFINDQVALGKVRIDPFNRWLNDTDSVLTTLGQNETLAKTKIQSFYSKNYNLTATYNATVQILTTSVAPLTNLNSYLTEMLTYLRSQPL